MLSNPLLGIECFHIMSCVWSNVFWHDQLIMKIVTLPLFQESSITDEVEAELRPASNNSSHTPILPSKKIRPPRDDSLPSPRGVNMPGNGYDILTCQPPLTSSLQAPQCPPAPRPFSPAGPPWSSCAEGPKAEDALKWENRRQLLPREPGV